MKKTIRVDFYHDVLCAWCYVASPRLRKLVEAHPEIEVVHHSYALAPKPDSFFKRFGSKEEALLELTDHWADANEEDDHHRLQPGLMLQRDFEFPYSLPGLMACKAAENQKGMAGYWDYFDKIQQAHFTDCLDIMNEKVLTGIAKELNLDIARFIDNLHNKEISGLILNETREAKREEVRSIPELIINHEKRLNGAVKFSILEEAFKEYLFDRNPTNTWTHEN